MSQRIRSTRRGTAAFAVAVGMLVALVLAGLASGELRRTTATGATGDHDRRLAGPFCINDSSGLVRVVAASQKCQAGETRRYGVEIPHPESKPGPRGPYLKQSSN